MNEVKARRLRQLNAEFLPSLKTLVQEFEEGKIDSMIVFTRRADGTTEVGYSYAYTYQEDAAALMSMAMSRMGFNRGD